MALPLSRPFFFLNPSKSPSFLSLYSTLLCLDLRLPEIALVFPKIAGCLGPFFASRIAPDVYPSAAELILALGLTKWSVVVD